MKRKHIKKYTIHIMAISAIGHDTFDLPRENNAIIVCTISKNNLIYQCDKKNVLILDFLDVEDKKHPKCFTRAHARAVIRFIDSLDENVTDLYVVCSKGASRSPAMAAALLRVSGRSDKCVWKNPYYVPNTLVYYRLCNEYHIRVSWLEVWWKVKMSNLAYKKAQKNKQSDYERWEILF